MIYGHDYTGEAYTAKREMAMGYPSCWAGPNHIIQTLKFSHILLILYSLDRNGDQCIFCGQSISMS